LGCCRRRHLQLLLFGPQIQGRCGASLLLLLLLLLLQAQGSAGGLPQPYVAPD
jgi:hypothetical protein